MGSVLFSMLSLFMMVKPCFGEADLKVAGGGGTQRHTVQSRALPGQGHLDTPSTFPPLHHGLHQCAGRIRHAGHAGALVKSSPTYLTVYVCTYTQLVSLPML